MAAILNHIEALEARILHPASGNNMTKKQADPFLVDKPKKKNEKKDPLAVGSSNVMTEPTETELKLNTIQDFYGSSSDSDADDEEFGDDMESVDQSEDEGNGSGVTNYHHRKNYFHFYRSASEDDNQKKRTKLYYAKRIFVVKTIFALCVFIMMGGAVVRHKHVQIGTGTGADFVPGASHSNRGRKRNKHQQEKSKDGEQMTMAELLNEKVEDETLSVAKKLEYNAETGEAADEEPLPVLPGGWRQFTDKTTGKAYYEDPHGHVTWERPISNTASQSGSPSEDSDNDDEKREKFILETSKVMYSGEDKELPEGWREYTDKESGHEYYMDARGQTTWERPTSKFEDKGNDSDGKSDESEEALPRGWREYKDKETGRSYYMDPHGKTTWERPRSASSPSSKNTLDNDKTRSRTSSNDSQR